MTMEEQQANTLPPAEPELAPPPPPPSSVMVPTPEPVASPMAPAGVYSNAQPVWQFILLNVFTLTLYQMVWFYRNWHLLKARNELRITPLVRTIFSPIFAWSFFGELRKLVGPNYAWPMGTSALATCYFISMIISNTLDRVDKMTDDITPLTIVSLIMGFVTIMPLVPAVRALNAFWADEQPGLPMRTSLSGGAIVTMVIGSLWYLLMLLGLLFQL